MKSPFGAYKLELHMQELSAYMRSVSLLAGTFDRVVFMVGLVLWLQSEWASDQGISVS